MQHLMDAPFLEATFKVLFENAGRPARQQGHEPAPASPALPCKFCPCEYDSIQPRKPSVLASQWWRCQHRRTAGASACSLPQQVRPTMMITVRAGRDAGCGGRLQRRAASGKTSCRATSLSHSQTHWVQAGIAGLVLLWTTRQLEASQSRRPRRGEPSQGACKRLVGAQGRRAHCHAHLQLSERLWAKALPKRPFHLGRRAVGPS